jgi:histidine triad (HIT) family protein
METVFEKIITRKLPATILLETDFILVIKDIHPKAPHHYLIISKKVIPSLQEMSGEDQQIYLPKMVAVAQEVAEKLKVKDYRLIINNGPLAGQTVFHFHIHFLAGKTMGEDFA